MLLISDNYENNIDDEKLISMINMTRMKRDKLCLFEDHILENMNTAMWHANNFDEGIATYLTLPYSDKITDFRKLKLIWEQYDKVYYDKLDLDMKKSNLPSGMLSPEFVFIGEAPGWGPNNSDYGTRVYTFGPTSILFRIYSYKVFGTKNWYTNIFKAAIENNKGIKDTEKIEFALGKLLTELNLLHANNIICLGNYVYDTITNLDLSAISAGFNVSKIYHPAYVARKGNNIEYMSQMNNVKKKLKSNRKDIVILQNNIMFLDLMLQKFPMNYIENYNFIFVTDDRDFDMKGDIVEVAEKYDIRYSIISGNKVFDYVCDVLKLPAAKEDWLRSLKVGLKYILPVYMKSFLNMKKFLYVDDDVVFFKDPDGLFKYENAISTEGILNRYGEDNVKDVEEFEELKKVFELDYTMEEFNKKTINSGIFFITVHDDFIKYLKSFFSSDLFYKRYEDRHKAKWRAAVIEQRFYAFYMKKHSGHIFSSDEVIFRNSKVKGKLQNRMYKIPIALHYAPGKEDKIKYANWIQKLQWKTINSGKTILEFCGDN